MRILHLLDIPWHSGLADYALTLAEAQRRSGDDVWVAAPRGTDAARTAQRSGLPVLPFSRWADLPALGRFLRSRRIEIVNAHTGSAHSLAAAAAGLRRLTRDARRLRVVRTRADARPLRSRPFAPLLAGRTAAYIAATERIRCDLREALRLPEERAVTVYPSVDLADPWTLPAWGDPAAGHVGGGASRPFLVQIGRLDPVKGHAIFLEAAARIRRAVTGAEFAIVGREEHLSIADLRGQADALGLGASVVFPGHAPSVAPWMRRASLGIIASVGSEAVSRVALEWLACARPVVASAVGGLPEFIEHDRTGLLVPPGRAEALAEAALSLLQNPARLQTMAACARGTAETRFSRARLVGETARVYAEALCRS